MNFLVPPPPSPGIVTKFLVTQGSQKLSGIQQMSVVQDTLFDDVSLINDFHHIKRCVCKLSMEILSKDEKAIIKKYIEFVQ